MTVPRFSAAASYATCDAFDHGLSEAARSLHLMLAQATAFADSMTLGQRRDNAREALFDTYCNTSEKNWDSEGAAPADPLSYGYACSVLDALPSWVPNPEIYTDPDGEFCLEWDYGARNVFSVSIGRDGTLTYAGLFGSSKSHGVEPFNDTLPLLIIQNLERTIPPRSC